MDIDPPAEHVMLRDAARAFAETRLPMARVRELGERPEGFDADLWREAAALGWCALLVPEEYGGAGRGSEGVLDAAVLAEEMGRTLVPGPFLAVNLVADTLVRTPNEPQREARLPGLVTGETVATFAVAEGPGSWDSRGLSVMARARGDGFRISGVKRWVQDAASADFMVVACRHEGGIVELLVPCETPGLRVTPLATADLGRRLADVEFHDVSVEAEGILFVGADAEAQLARQLRLAVVIQCAESVGVAVRMVEKTVVYAQQRVAFGRPIGSFQAVKHILAEGATALEAAQSATWSAAHALAEDRTDLPRAVHVAKSFVAGQCPRIVERCMQVHGGIAMTWEDDSHLYLRRLRSNEVLFGSPAWHADRLCDVVGMAV